MTQPVELQAHYVSLLCEAIQAAGGFCRIRPRLPGDGYLFVSRSETTTKADYCIQYDFDEWRVRLVVTFADSRPRVTYEGSFWDGIDGFFPLFSKALKANRLSHEAAQEPA